MHLLSVNSKPFILTQGESCLTLTTPGHVSGSGLEFSHALDLRGEDHLEVGLEGQGCKFRLG
jgi:hypothetical protein